jgi:DNA-binding NtrC family response regulator
MVQSLDEGGRILIVDEDKTFRDSTASLLGQEHYECVCAPDATTAAESLRAAAFDLLITDVKMPGNLNLELIQGIIDSIANIPLVLVTGHPSLHSAIESFQLPVVAYLVKPFERDDLLAAVDKAMAAARLSRVARTMSQRLQNWHQDLDNACRQQRGIRRTTQTLG